MDILHLLSKHEQRLLEICKNLIEHKCYHTQIQLCYDLRKNGFKSISQSTVSRLLKHLGAIKIVNSKGEKIYIINSEGLPKPNTEHPISEMVINVEYNSNFILIYTNSGYGKAIAKILDYYAIADIIGIIANSNVVWVTPKDTHKIEYIYRCIRRIFCEKNNSN
ncbi:arginine repressor [Providencia sp. Me31A]|uniref:arginine repressor n=1 Tax=Providencia sp. Me31A TaxID=3392637 RepID=UPI003D2C3A82